MAEQRRVNKVVRIQDAKNKPGDQGDGSSKRGFWSDSDGVIPTSEDDTQHSGPNFGQSMHGDMVRDHLVLFRGLWTPKSRLQPSSGNPRRNVLVRPHTPSPDARQAAKRSATTELLFFASVGDLRRCQRIIRLWKLDVRDKTCCDYDRRTPLHLAASEGAYKVTEWLIKKGADVNALDRFGRTPLEDAVRGDYREVVKLLMDSGAKLREGGKMVGLGDSDLASSMGMMPQKLVDIDPEWELDPANLVINEKLGEGEFGIVHKARWFGTVVAAKMLKGSSDIALGDFRGEIDILRRVHHPNAVQFFGACSKREPYILVTELMNGGSLADAFQGLQAFPFRRAIQIALDAARGLAYLHNRRPSPIIHRDLKPGNLMFTGSPYQSKHEIIFKTGVCKLADFGLSKTLPVNKHAEYGYLDSKYRMTGETGSYRYMAPEVFRHEPYNSSVDVYSYSMILFQLVEGSHPFSGMDPISAAKNAAMADLRPRFVQLSKTANIPAYKTEARELIENCWRPNPELRPSFESIVVTLESILAKVPAPSSAGNGGGCCAS
jgi:hypothetical protein